MLILVSEALFLFTLIFCIESSFFRTLTIKFANFRIRRRLRDNKVHATNKSVDDELLRRRYEGKDARSVGFEILIKCVHVRAEFTFMVDELGSSISSRLNLSSLLVT